MKTFQEFLKERDYAEEFSSDIVAVGNKLAAQNPKVVPGMTDIKDVKTMLKQPAVSALAAKGKNPGAVGAYLAGPEIAKKSGLPVD